jgi:hypothetical protein
MELSNINVNKLWRRDLGLFQGTIHTRIYPEGSG